jgi:cobalamin biosynthesis Mg chelatase CobN
MAINLVSLVQQVLTPQMVSTLARAVGVNEAVAQKLVAAALPAILAALATAAAAPGGAQKVSDAISNSDPDLLTKLSGAVAGGNTQLLSEGANLLSGLLGGGGLATLAAALSQHAGAPQAAAQPLIGAVTHAVVGTIGQQDPSNWSDPSAILSMFNSQKSAIAAALPGDVAKALGASGLLAGLGGAATAAAQTATSTVSSAATAASSAARSAQAAASRSSGFPMWAIILIVVVVLVAIYWFVTQSQKPAEPAKTGMFDPSSPIEYALQAAPSPIDPKRG